MEQAITLDTPEKIAAARILTWRAALKLEVKGMKISRGRSVYAIVKDQFGFRGSKQKVLDQLNVYIEQNILPREA